MNGYMTVQETAERWGITERQVDSVKIVSQISTTLMSFKHEQSPLPIGGGERDHLSS